MKKYVIIPFFIVSLLFFSGLSFAQSYTLKLKTNTEQNPSIVKKLNYKKTFTSETARTKELKNILFWFYDNGFITAKVDSLAKDSLNLTVFVDPGEKYKLVTLSKGNAENILLGEAGFQYKFFNQTVFRYKEISKLMERILTYYENNGYPFAAVKLDSLKITGNSISASLNVNKNKKIRIDSIINKGDAKITNVYLYSYTGLKPNDLYNETKILRINTKLKELPFLNINKPFKVTFADTGAKIFFFADKRKASQFDGVIGFMPNNQTTGKLLVSGEAHLKLLNSFGRGELLDINWRRLQEQTQDLNLNIVYPFLFSTPFGIDYKFYLYKKDSTYITLRNNIGIQYIFQGNNYLKAFIDNSASNLIKNKGLDNLTTLPPYADITTTLYGLELKHEELDYIFNPRKGYQVKLSAATGTKNIKKNDNISPALYDSVKLKTTQYQLESNLGLFIPFYKRSTLYLNNRTAYIGNPNLFDNELFRIGGLKTLRGFDEESIHASFYNILLVEYRYILEKNSYLNLFWNGCYYEKRLHNAHSSDMPFGFGAGITFQTKAGIFSINYALGKQQNNSIDLKSGKIHFGIVSYF